MTPAKVKPLYEKLFDIQQALPTLAMTEVNPAFGNKYLKMAGVMEYLNPLLLKHRVLLGFEYAPDTNSTPVLHKKAVGGMVHCQAVFTCADTGERHSTGFISMPVRDWTMHSCGASNTYVKTKILVSALNIQAEVDNDGADHAVKQTGGSHETDDMMGG